MSITASHRPGDLPTLDVSDTPGVPFTRLVGVELRKMRDTRAGFWLVLSTAILLLIAAAITLLVVALNDITVGAGDVVQIMTIPVSLLLPVLAITAVTSEWSQRTGLVTFTLEPTRMRVIAAKLAAVLALAILTMVLAFAVGALTTLLAGAIGGGETSWSIDKSGLAWTVVNQMLYFLMGFGFGLLLLSTPAAVAIFYVIALLLPFMVYGPIVGIFSWGMDVVPWLDLGFAMTPLLGGDTGALDATAWAQVGVTTLVWVVLPLTLGLLRVRRAELA